MTRSPPCCVCIRDPFKAHKTGCSATSRTGFNKAWQLPNLFEMNTNSGGEGAVPRAEEKNILLAVLSGGDLALGVFPTKLH